MDNTKLHVNKKKNTTIFIVVFLMLIGFYPYEFYSAYLLFLPDRAYILASILFCIAFFIILSSSVVYDKSSIRPLYYITGVCMIGVIINGFIKERLPSIPERSVFMLLAIALTILIEKYSDMRAFFRKYNRWICFSSVAAALVFILASTSVIHPTIYFPDRAEIGRIFSNYILSFAAENESIFRCCGFFDEPGALAYWVMYALLINKLFINDTKIEIPLIISSIFTFSFGYYLQLIVYLLLFIINKQNILKCLSIFLFVLVFLQGTKLTEGTKYEFVYNMTYKRFESILVDTEEYNSLLLVDDRKDLTENAKKEFELNPLFGTENNSVETGNNFYEPLATYGMIGTFCLLFPFIWLLASSIRNKDYDMLKGLFVIFLGFSHRPFRYNVLYFFIIYSMIIMYRKKRTETTFQ